MRGEEEKKLKCFARDLTTRLRKQRVRPLKMTGPGIADGDHLKDENK